MKRPGEGYAVGMQFPFFCQGSDPLSAIWS
uniref:Uncharacterized protein n=1 Tax=Anguilla anguilla TaxID=7936 RepID=A0A0E9VTZ8_ANGAN